MTYARIIFITILMSLSALAHASEDTFDIMTENSFVPISVDFTGRTMQIYGATNIKGNIIITIRGKDIEFALHKKSKQYGMWVNKKYAYVKAPSYYKMLSSAPINASLFQKNTYIGIQNVPHEIRSISGNPNKDELWRDAVMAQSRLGRYSYQANSIVQKGKLLFQASVKLPSDIPTGTYTLSAYIKDKDGLRQMTERKFYVVRSGITKFLYKNARDHALWYALFSILFSILIGVGATYQPRKY